MIINPLDALKKRELNFLPAHFVKAGIDSQDDEKIKNWIRNKLHGRFCLIDITAIEEKKIKTTKVIAFEQHHELTYFMLACPYTRR